MPNWTHNTLRITGEKIDMDHFYDSALKMDINNEMSFSFSNLFPIPEKIKNTISPSSSALGKKWINENLSTKRSEKLSEILNEEDGGAQEIIDEEELRFMQKLKEVKRVYRKHFNDLTLYTD
jgi:hypothetical protein